MSGRTATVIGVDEAGLAPFLGPLVISACAFSVPEGFERNDLWKILAGCVTREMWLRRFKVLVDDSKKLYSPQKGLEVLEESVLSFLRLAGGHCASAGELLDRVGVGIEDLSVYPWYQPDGQELPLSADTEQIEKLSAVLTDGLSTAGVVFEGFCVHPVFERSFNRQIDSTGNKATALFNQTAVVLGRMLERFPGDLLVHCDQHGGRKFYTRLWAEAFPGSAFRILVQNDTMSHYIVKWKGRKIEVVFADKSDQAVMPVALASMMSKFVREVFMHRFNRYWAGHQPGLKPTAGYPTDARRFLADIDPLRKSLGIEDEQLIRKK